MGYWLMFLLGVVVGYFANERESWGDERPAEGLLLSIIVTLVFLIAAGAYTLIVR